VYVDFCPHFFRLKIEKRKRWRPVVFKTLFTRHIFYKTDVESSQIVLVLGTYLFVRAECVVLSLLNPFGFLVYFRRKLPVVQEVMVVAILAVTHAG
jgi:hypothetical protein